MKKTLIIIFNILLVSTILFPLTSCGGNKHPDTLEYGLYTEPDQLDPDLGNTLVGRVVMNLMFDKLFDFDQAKNIIPEMATSYEWRDNNKTLELKLRKGIVFADNTPFNAQAVKYNLERSIHLKSSRRATELKKVSEVKVIDDYTVDIELKTPYTPLITILTDRAGMMISPTASKKADADGVAFSKNPVGSGVFDFVKRVPESTIELKKSTTNYRQKEIFIKSVVFHMIIDNSVRMSNLKAGDINIGDFSGHEAKELTNDNNYKTISVDGLGYYDIEVNIANTPSNKKNNPFYNPKVRQALELAIDRKQYVDIAYDAMATPMNQMVTPDSKYYNQKYPMPQRNVEKAKALLKEAGYSLPIKFTFKTSTSAINRKAAEVLQSMIKEAGFEMKIETIEFVTLLSDMKKGNFSVGMNGWSGRLDMDGDLSEFYLPGGSNNFSGTNDPVLTSLINRAKTESNEKTRTALYKQILGILAKTKQEIFLLNRPYIWSMDKKITGFTGLADGTFRLYNTKIGK